MPRKKKSVNPRDETLNVINSGKLSLGIAKNWLIVRLT